MKTILFWIISFASIINIAAQDDTLLKLWYTSPAKQWVEALPIGNGQS